MKTLYLECAMGAAGDIVGAGWEFPRPWAQKARPAGPGGHRQRILG